MLYYCHNERMAMSKNKSQSEGFVDAIDGIFTMHFAAIGGGTGLFTSELIRDFMGVQKLPYDEVVTWGLGIAGYLIAGGLYLNFAIQDAKKRKKKNVELTHS